MERAKTATEVDRKRATHAITTTTATNATGVGSVQNAMVMERWNSTNADAFSASHRL
jgi:hypothetical protein